MYSFYIYTTDVDIPELVKEFHDSDVNMAFDYALNWIALQYKDENAPNYEIISKFGSFRP